MKEFYYSFAIAMLHSIWQMAILFLISSFFFSLYKKLHPNFKKNILYSIVLMQVCTSIITFLFCYFKPSFSENILSGIFSVNTSGLMMSHWAEYLFYAYCIIVWLKIGGILFQYYQFRVKLSSHLQKPDIDIRVFTTQKAFEFGIKRKVQIRLSDRVSTPLTFGFLRPLILLPIALVNKLTIQETEALIIHELTHIKHNDYLINWLLLVTESIYFFNPFFKLILQKIKLEREKTCDTQVIHFKYSPILYAEALLKIETLRRSNSFQLTAVNSKAQLLKRIQFFSNDNNRSFINRNFLLPGIAILIFVFAANIYIPGVLYRQVSISKSSPVLPINSANIVEANRSFNTVLIKQTIQPKEKIQPASEANNLSRKMPTLAKKINTLPQTTLASDYKTVNVAYTETDSLLQHRQVEVSEENSSGKTVTKVYNIDLKNGKWVIRPLYMTTEIKSSKDSLKIKPDTTALPLTGDIQ
ncbi:MAG: M56 family metallopeptidase [Bacteroidetes bacterium]|nr:M56 family metallopeptidase [Bacteroidota bacterium]